MYKGDGKRDGKNIFHFLSFILQCKNNFIKGFERMACNLKYQTQNL